ncbi:MAG: hypothetical protein ABTS16_16550 [Candidatus Accumulibacter phosphatis]|uniref:Uncharacterized protein n=1 Tax=Candidatus Accumulibacter contiguus TaxID=2954381 RepID=A0ABX1T8Q5_9PROT|nr:hypothetical protein [Candidatus Accumulibacter contiguus]NMQ05361.1 hypothetical protein [Candidatus Accumulibacter contiguus]
MVLGVFHGAVDLSVLRDMTGWQPAEVQAFGEALVASGLATAEAYNHLSLNLALCLYLAAQLEPAARAALAERWTTAMGSMPGSWSASSTGKAKWLPR